MPIYPASGGASSSSTVTQTTVRIANDIADKTDTTVADATGLLFALVSGNVYRFKFSIIFQTAATTTGIKLGLTTPSFSKFGAVVRIPVAGDGTNGEWQGYLNSSGDVTIGTGVEVINQDFLAEIEGIIIPSGNGNLQVQYASEVGASAVRIRGGSLGVLELVA